MPTAKAADGTDERACTQSVVPTPAHRVVAPYGEVLPISKARILESEALRPGAFQYGCKTVKQLTDLFVEHFPIPLPIRS